MKKPPVDISTLSKIIYEGYAYADKSAMVYKLVEKQCKYSGGAI